MTGSQLSVLHVAIMESGWKGTKSKNQLLSCCLRQNWPSCDL